MVMYRFIYRGKTNDGEWVEGSLLYNMTDNLTQIVSDAWLDEHGEWCFNIHEVEPSTVGQCAVLHDKNDVRIFEKDLLRDPYGHILQVGFGHYVDSDDDFSQTMYGWYFKDLTGITGATFGFGRYASECAVIGNIFDNPELLPKAQ